MHTLRRNALVLTALAWLATGCDQPNEPTEPTEAPSLAVVGGVFTEPVDLIVDDDGFADAATGNCNAVTPTHMMIQTAINAASPGQTIGVCPGLYPEPLPAPLTVNKSVTLLGAQSGVDARTRAAVPITDEAVINDLQGTSISASNVVMDGFTVQNSTSPAFTGFGIWMNPGISGTRLLNNIIQRNIAGIGLANSGGAQAVIEHNWIRDNNAAGGASGTGIYTDQFSGGPVVRNVLIDENRFSGHAGGGAAINLSNTNAAGGVFGLEVSDNEFAANNRAFVLFNTHDSRFHDNRVTGSTFVASADVRIFDNNSGLLFTNNDLNNGAGMHAIRFSFLGAVGGPSSDVDFHQNNIEVYGLTGLTVDPGSHVGTVDAECNWWNSPTGPVAVDNPGGTGEEVVGDADYRPWLTSRAPGGACVGGLPSGKVTGGGQINVAGGKGSFGFNARQDDGVAKGHLNYINHASGAKLNCTVTLITVLTATTAEFEGTCDSKSSSASFEAHVEDNGQSGKNDVFRISYGPTEGGPLRSGNIQIHN